MRREGVLLDLPDGDGVKKRAKKSGNCEQDPCTIQITHLVLSLSVLSSPLSWCCRSVLPLMRALAAGPVNRAPAGQTRVARGEKGRGVGRSRHDENTTRVAITANCTPARRPIPSARVRSIAALGELRFRRGTRFTPFPLTPSISYLIVLTREKGAIYLFWQISDCAAKGARAGGLSRSASRSRAASPPAWYSRRPGYPAGPQRPCIWPLGHSPASSSRGQPARSPDPGLVSVPKMKEDMLFGQYMCR